MAQLERSKQLEYNLAVLKRRDASITRVLDMAGHVVLYQFNEDSKAWDRKNMEGSLFVVERSTEPQYQFVVLNRLSSENLVETIDSEFQTELTEQFLLYRNAASEILGIWFYSPPERTAISELLNSLSAGDEPAPVDTADPEPSPAPTPAPAPAPAAPAGDNVAQLFSMLSGAAQGAPPMPATAMTADAAAAATKPMTSAPPAIPAATEMAVAAGASAAPPPVSAAALAPPTRPAVDMAALKTKLAGQLRSLIDDDGFLSLLANEYLRQQQRAKQQAQAARAQREGAGA